MSKKEKDPKQYLAAHTRQGNWKNIFTWKQPQELFRIFFLLTLRETQLFIIHCELTMQCDTASTKS